jgi:DNA (cytosine-5)-methyltransferase 1
MLRVLDLFSGIGGFSLGLERTGGFETVAFCEMKPHARAVLAEHWPDVRCHDDVTTYDFKQGEADVITAGFPCQDISFAGEGAGLAGARSGLYREVIRAVRMVRPKWAVLENVAALLSRGLGTVLGDLAEIGFDAEWHCIPASALGAPHIRERIWIIANPHEVGRDWPGRYLERADVIRDGCQWTAAPFGGWRDVVDWLKSPNANPLWEATHREIGRVDDGVLRGLDRDDIGALGNAVVPQIPELIGHAILASMQEAA